jgi:hypothetical protein
MPSTRISEWLLRLLILIFLLAHKNANEPARGLPHWHNSGRTPAAVVLSVMADVIGFFGKLLVLSVKCNGRCNTVVRSVTNSFRNVTWSHGNALFRLVYVQSTSTGHASKFTYFTCIKKNFRVNAEFAAGGEPTRSHSNATFDCVCGPSGPYNLPTSLQLIISISCDNIAFEQRCHCASVKMRHVFNRRQTIMWS